MVKGAAKSSAGTAPPSLFRPSPREAVGVILVGLGSLLLALYLRYGIIQNIPLGLACDAGDASLTCRLRSATIQIFTHDILGMVALTLAAFQLWRPNVAAFGTGLAFSAFGLVLYNTRLSALAIALLVLSLARASPVAPPARGL
jgi:hypothetical protein